MQCFGAHKLCFILRYLFTTGGFELAFFINSFGVFVKLFALFLLPGSGLRRRSFWWQTDPTQIGFWQRKTRKWQKEYEEKLSNICNDRCLNFELQQGCFWSCLNPSLQPSDWHVTYLGILISVFSYCSFVGVAPLRRVWIQSIHRRHSQFSLSFRSCRGQIVLWPLRYQRPPWSDREEHLNHEKSRAFNVDFEIHKKIKNTYKKPLQVHHQTDSICKLFPLTTFEIESVCKTICVVKLAPDRTGVPS